MVRSVRKDGYLTEQAATMLLNFRPDVTRFISEARLEDQKQPRIEVDHRYVISDGQLRELPMKMGPLLMSDIWSMRTKLRMMLEPLARRSHGGEESVSEFVRRRFGGEVLEKALGPYVAGLLASDPDRASAEAVLPRLKALERRWGSIVLGALVHRVLRRRSAVQTEAFSFQGGMATLAGVLAEADQVVGVKAPEQAFKRLSAAGLSVELLRLAGATHAFDDAHASDPRTRHDPAHTAACRAFFVDALRQSLG